MNIELLQKLISIKSDYPNEKLIGDFLFQQLQLLGFNTQKQLVESDRYNIIGEKGSGSSCLFYGHMDTVPVQGEWNTNPFELIETNGKLFGLGAMDMKGGIFCLLEALKETSDTYCKFKIKIAFCVDEENISKGAFKLLESDFLDDVKLIISVDAAVGINNTPADKRSVVLGRRGRLPLKLIVPGLSAHAAQKGLGINAITEAMKVIKELDKLEPIKHPQLGNSSCYPQAIYAESKGLSIPDTCEIELNTFLVPPQHVDSELLRIQQFIDNLYNNKILIPINGQKVQVELVRRETTYLSSYITEETEPHVSQVLNILKKVYSAIVINYGGSVGDECIFATKNIPIITLGAEGENEHAANECTTILSLERLVEAYKAMISELAPIDEK